MANRTHKPTKKGNPPAPNDYSDDAPTSIYDSGERSPGASDDAKRSPYATAPDRPAAKAPSPSATIPDAPGAKAKPPSPYATTPDGPAARGKAPSPYATMPDGPAAKAGRAPAQSPAPPVLPPQPAAPAPAPKIQAISMKTPANPNLKPVERPEREMPHVKLRQMSEVARAQHPQNLGNLAPPYDPAEARKRTVREYVVWGSLAVIIASAIALVVWFVAT